MTNPKPPPDVVPPAPPTREQILGWNSASGTPLPVVVPGKIEDDPDGIPQSVGPSTTYHDMVSSLAVYRDQLDAVGLTPDDVPNLTVYDRGEVR